MSPCKLSEQLLEEVRTSTTSSRPCSAECAGKILEVSETKWTTAESRACILIGVGVESRLLGGWTILVVLSSLLVVFEDLDTRCMEETLRTKPWS